MMARLVPTLSDMRPAMGRLSRVARYCEPMVNPAITALNPSCSWTYPGNTAIGRPMQMKAMKV
ncbi:hypothetical protein D3C73_1431060 [compost metagenome]